MGNSCPGSCGSVSKDEILMYEQADRVQIPKRSAAYAHVNDSPIQHPTNEKRGHGNIGSTGFHSTFDATLAEGIPMGILVEHYQPYEFPICPVINSDTQSLVRNSWAKIMATEFDSCEFGGGKVSGATYFYNHFFQQLFSRLADFSRIFPDIKSRADIFSKVMSFCISIRIEELELVKAKLRHLGQMHKTIIHHPHLFGIYASNMHSSIRHCLGDNAHHEVMSAWLHLLSFILRGMLPAYFHGLNFTGHYNGAVNAASTINEKARDQVRATDDMRVLRSKLASIANTEPPSRLGNGQELTGREREHSQTMVDNGATTKTVKDGPSEKNERFGDVTVSCRSSPFELSKRSKSTSEGGGASPIIRFSSQEKDNHIPGTINEVE